MMTSSFSEARHILVGNCVWRLSISAEKRILSTPTTQGLCLNREPSGAHHGAAYAVELEHKRAILSSRRMSWKTLVEAHGRKGMILGRLGICSQ